MNRSVKAAAVNQGISKIYGRWRACMHCATTRMTLTTVIA